MGYKLLTGVAEPIPIRVLIPARHHVKPRKHRRDGGAAGKAGIHPNQIGRPQRGQARGGQIPSTRAVEAPGLRNVLIIDFQHLTTLPRAFNL